MKTGKFEISIDSLITDEEVLEHCLNLSHQGYQESATLILAFFGMSRQFGVDELLFYAKEMGITNE